MPTGLLLLSLCLPAAAFDGSAAQGLKDWRLYCSACHGDDGRGRRGVEELQKLPEGTLDLTGRGLEGWPEESLKASIERMAEKRPGLAGSHSLSSATVAGLISYLRIVARGDAVVLSTAAFAEVKDPGERAYLKACAPCHGRSGAGAFDSAWSAPADGGTVDLRPPLPPRKVREPKRIEPEWISFDGELTNEEIRALERYLDKLEAAQRRRR